MPFPQTLATDRRLRDGRLARVAAHPGLHGLERVEPGPPGRGRFDIDLRFIASHAEGKSAPPPALAPGDVTVRPQRPGAPAHPARALERVDAVTLRAVFDPLAVLEEGAEPEILVVELRPGPHLDPLFRSAVLPLDDAPSPAELRDRIPGPPEPADVDYLARDYDGYRRLMLDRMAGLRPDWTERHAADLGVTMVEALAYAADQLSYFQDAVATEAYLSTARRRTSVKRHARLLDAHVHDGCAARVWVRLRVDGSAVIRRGLRLACDHEASAHGGGRLAEADPTAAFETLADVRVRAAHNQLAFHDWGARDYALPAGATTAVLTGGSDLRAGDVLILAAVADPATGLPRVEPGLRHPVRLVRDARAFSDPLVPEPLVEVSWAAEDAPPFDLPVVSSRSGRPVSGLAEAWGNIAPADAGAWTEDPTPHGLDAQGWGTGLQLPLGGLVYAAPYDDREARAAPAAAFLRPDPREAAAEVRLVEIGDATAVWRPARDLLDAGRFARRFVAETEEDGTTRLRFGDGRHSRRPEPEASWRVRMRLGRMDLNVGPDSLVSWMLRGEEADAVIAGVSNPLPALGGVGPEPLAQARLRAPAAFRRQLRCVTPDDFTDAAFEHPGVVDAVADESRPGGRGLTVVRILPRGGGAPSRELLREVTALLEDRRVLDSRFVVRPPRFVPLELHLRVEVAAPRRAAEARRDALARVRDLLGAGAQRFGGVVATGPLVAAVMQGEGVLDVHVQRLRRRGSDEAGAPSSGRLELAPWEVAQLDDVLTAAGRGLLRIDAEALS